MLSHTEMFSYYLHHLLLRNNMDNFRRMNISYRNNGHITIRHSDSSKTNLNHFLTKYELIPSIIRDPTCMQATPRPEPGVWNTYYGVGAFVLFQNFENCNFLKIANLLILKEL